MLSGTIVLYNNDVVKLQKAIDSFLKTPCEKQLFLVDNSETSKLEDELIIDSTVTYIHTGKNLGFGTAHNVVIDYLKNSSFHLILNPDIYFENHVLIEMMGYMKHNQSIGLLGPKVLYPNGELQHLIRKFPNTLDFIIRTLPLAKVVFKKRYNRAHYLDQELNQPKKVECVSGCFQLYRTDVFIKVNGFDERYFMYLEDVDICRKVFELGVKTYYYPLVEVYHYFEKGSSKSFRLFRAHLNSIFKYLKKW